MRRRPFDFSVRVLAPDHPARYVVGMAMLGCLKHDQVAPMFEVTLGDWKCPLCGFRPPPDAERSPLVVKHVDYPRGVITVG